MWCHASHKKKTIILGISYYERKLTIYNDTYVISISLNLTYCLPDNAQKKIIVEKLRFQLNTICANHNRKKLIGIIPRMS